MRPTFFSCAQAQQLSSRGSPRLPSAHHQQQGSVESQLAAAQLRITQLLCTPDVGAYGKILATLSSTERDMQTTIAEFRYTQMSLSATHAALEEEVRNTLALASMESSDSVRRNAVLLGAKSTLRRHLGFRSERVSESAALISTATKQLGQLFPESVR